MRPGSVRPEGARRAGCHEATPSAKPSGSSHIGKWFSLRDDDLFGVVKDLPEPRLEPKLEFDYEEWKQLVEGGDGCSTQVWVEVVDGTIIDIRQEWRATFETS